MAWPSPKDRFAAGEKDFQDAFLRMADVENRCRGEYFQLVKERSKR